MKNLYLIRHAKSDWSDASKSDYDRGLNKRGKKSILTMSNALKDKHILPDLILSSSAKRTKLTTKGLVKGIGYTGEIKYIDTLYMAEPQEVITLIQNIEDKYNTVFIVGHNPETTELSYMITNSYIDNVPTLGIVSIELPIDSWKNMNISDGALKFFIYPKMFQK
jgi:phosphohistidine phosphatase